MIDSVSESLEEMADASAKLAKTHRQPRKAQLVPLDRLPPFSEAAEQGVLGCCLLDPNESINECLTKLGTDGKLAFYDLRHQAIYHCLATLRNENSQIDLIIVQQWFQDKNQLEQIGGIAYLSQLQDAVPSAANLSYYLDIVREKFTLRRLLATCTGIVGQIYEYKGEVESLLDEVEKEFLAIGSSKNDVLMPTAKEFIYEAINNIEKAWNNNGQPSGLSTGIADLDKQTDGLHPGEMIVIAARPSIGKTSLAMNIAEHVALTLKLPVGVFSLEMTGASLMERMLGSVAKVNIRKLKQGFCMESDTPKITLAAGKIGDANIQIDDTSGLSIIQLRARARRMHQQHGIKLFVIDYLQLIHATVNSSDNREREISAVSSGIKELAKELKVPIIVLSQFNRELEKEKRKPRLSDLRESGSIEQDADVVGLLYAAKAEEPKSQAESDAGMAVNLLIAKQRNGPRDVLVHLTFLKEFTRFEQAAHFHEEDLPAFNQQHND